jgi:hypothetical protein
VSGNVCPNLEPDINRLPARLTPRQIGQPARVGQERVALDDLDPAVVVLSHHAPLFCRTGAHGFTPAARARYTAGTQ